MLRGWAKKMSMNAKLMSGLDAINDTAMSPSSEGSVMDYLGYQLAKMNDVLGLSGSALCVSRAGHLLDKDNLLYLNYTGLESLIYFESATALEVSEQKIVETMASQISIGLENVNLYSKLKTTSFNDWLTKLPNRNEFINLISAMKTDLTVRKQLALVDLSHFSDINDGLGQDIGFYEIQSNVDAIYQLRCANVALNHAKKSISKNAAFYSPAMDDETRKRLDIIRNLQHDFECEKLEVWYQPQIDLLTEETVGVEALLRWRDLKGEFISPEVFVPLAEYSGLIVEIGKWVLVESVRRLKVLILAGYSNIRMAVNVSVLQFRDQSFVNYVKYVIDLHGIPPKLLELEITESVVMDEPEIVIQALNQLKAFGVHIAIDDFGTGFSSMSYIQKLPLDRLKIDRFFVKDIDTNKDAFIAQAIVNLGKQLGLITIAEGVERKSQASQMLKLGTDEAQGYLFAKPMPFSDLKTYLLSHSCQKVVPDNT